MGGRLASQTFSSRATSNVELPNVNLFTIEISESREKMASDSESSENAEDACKRAVTQLDQVVHAIRALGSRHGSSRDEIVDFLVSRDLMQHKIAKALVAKALYKGMDMGLIKRPRGANLYKVTSSKHSSRGRHSHSHSHSHSSSHRKSSRDKKRHTGRKTDSRKKRGRRYK